MKSFLTYTLLYSLIASVSAHAQALEPDNKENTAKDQQLIKIATLSSIDANQEFQRNVKIVQAAREQIVLLKKEYDAAADEDKKTEIQSKLENAVGKLNDMNKKMIEAYGFSLNRNYVLVIEKSHIYMHVSKEEAELIRENVGKETTDTKEDDE